MVTTRLAPEARTSKSEAVQIESLAVKYRPKLLTDLVGQDHIATQIFGMLKRKRFPSTMLLNGESGCGKTTTARIIARYLLCRAPDAETHAPCGECPSCRYGDGHPDISEINMAEARGIDDVRSLIQSSRSMPTVGKYRVFIVDEIHAMTPQAAQAFLKPLEEPPPQTLWILATTNPEKLPSTVLGRCHRFDVKRIEPEVLVRRLYRVAKREGVDFKTIDTGMEMLKLAADLSDGRMRNSLNLLESVLAAISSGQEVDSKTLLQKFLSTSETDADKAAAQLLVALLKGDMKALVHETRSMSNIRALLNKLRWLVQFLLDDSVGLSKYTPYSGKLFAKYSSTAGTKVSLQFLIGLQFVLLDTETKLNSLSIDESVVFLSMLGQFLIQQKALKP